MISHFTSGKWPRLNEIKRQVLPHAPSPTTTSFLRNGPCTVIIVEIY